MANVHGVAGEWARVNGMVLGLWPLFLSVFIGGFALALALFGSLLGGILLLIAAIVYGSLSLLRGLRHVERFFKGARGEERVSNILRNLPANYHVFNDFVAEGKHVDHVVVGPAGIFAIETKFWRGKVTVEDGYILVDGRLPSRAPLAQILKEAASVRTTLDRLGWKGKITPVLTFASDTFAHHTAELNGVVVLNSCELAPAFETRQVIIPPNELERIVALMENNRK